MTTTLLPNHLDTPEQVSRWLLELNDFLDGHEEIYECTCDPIYESDTNATIHTDDCATNMQGHVEIVLRETAQRVLDQARAVKAGEKHLLDLQAAVDDALDRYDALDTAYRKAESNAEVTTAVREIMHNWSKVRIKYSSERWTTEMAERLAACEAALDRIASTEEEDPCRLDHHGYCQAHNSFDSGLCWMQQARNALKGAL